MLFASLINHLAVQQIREPHGNLISHSKGEKEESSRERRELLVAGSLYFVPLFLQQSSGARCVSVGGGSTKAVFIFYFVYIYCGCFFGLLLVLLPIHAGRFSSPELQVQIYGVYLQCLAKVFISQVKFNSFKLFHCLVGERAERHASGGKIGQHNSY